ncbi:hypothetical protein ACFX13_005319 [Malus domestica]
MSQGQTHYEIETAAEPGVRARRVLTLLRSIQDCHRSLMKEKEAGGLNRAEMEEIDEAISRMASGQRSLFSLLRRLMTQELVNNGGGSLHVELVGNVQSEKDWKILEAIVDALNPLQQQLDQQGATSAAAASVASASAAASADESPGPLRRWILDRGKVILTVFTRILDLWLEDFVFLAMSRLNPIQWLVRRRWVNSFATSPTFGFDLMAIVNFSSSPSFSAVDIADFEDTDAFAGNQLRGSYGADSDFDDGEDFAEASRRLILRQLSFHSDSEFSSHVSVARQMDQGLFPFTNFLSTSV